MQISGTGSKIEKIPVGILAINFDDRLFSFLLFVVLIYFLSTFVLYYTIDIKNFENTAHQTRSEKAYREYIVTFPIDYCRYIERELKAIVPDGYTVTVPQGYATALRVSLDPPGPAYDLIQISAAPPASGRQQTRVTRTPENELIFARLEARQRYLVEKFALARRRNQFRAKVVLKLVQLMYLTRNYFVDGALPILLGLVALTAILGFINLQWLQGLFPTFNTLTK